MQRSRISSSEIVRRLMPFLAAKSRMIFSTTGEGLALRVLVVVVEAGAGLLAAAVHLAQDFADGGALRSSPSTSRYRGRRDRSSRTAPSASRNRRARGRRPRASRLRAPASAPRAGAAPACGCRRSREQTPTSAAILPILRASCMTVAITGFDGLCAAHDFQQPHHVGGREEVHADHMIRPAWSTRRDLVDVEIGGVGGEDRARLGDLVELARTPPS